MQIKEVIYECVGPFTSGPGGGGESNWAPWTMDCELPPSSVYALCNLSTYASRQNGQAGASAGVLSYVTQDPTTGMPSQPIVLSASPVALQTGSFTSYQWYLEEGLVSCFYDNNVITITFAYNCFADDWLYAWANFTVLVFD